MNDATEIKERLANRAEEVAKLLYPNGKRQGRDWVVGNVSGDPGQTLKICLEGERVGCWTDFDGSGGGNNLLELWKQRHNLNFATACREARQWLGIPQPLNSESSRLLTQPQTTRTASKLKGAPPMKDWKPLDTQGKVFAYLTQERKIPAATLKGYAVCEATADEWRKDKLSLTAPETIVFITKDPDKSIQMVKYLAIERLGGKKVIWTSKGSQKGLWGKHAIPEGDDDVIVITEGELDTLSLASEGIPAVSVPFGAKAETSDGRNPNAEWIENDYDWLAGFKRVILAFDADEAGQSASEGLIARLGRERCFIATPPNNCKDWNEALINGLGNEIQLACRNPAPCDPAEFRNASDFVEDLVEAIHSTSEAPAFGYENHLVPAFRIRPFEVTIWSGFSGHGKSLLLLQLMTALGDLGAKACIASLEIHTRKSLTFMLKQATGCSKPDTEVIEQFANWTESWLWFFDSVGTRDLGSLVETFEYAFKRYGVDQFVVDSLVKLGVAHDDYDGQKRTVERLCDFSAKYPVHVHLVCHSRKAQDEKRRPGKLDVAGHADITNLAHNGLTVWRNKEKEQLVRGCVETGKPLPVDISNTADGIVDVWKQRDTGEEPSVGLAFNLTAKTFVPLVEGRHGTLQLKSFKPKQSLRPTSNPSCRSHREPRL